MNSKASNVRLPISPKNLSSSSSSSSIDLHCPNCSNRDIRISEVHKSSTNSLQMKIQCDKCQNQKKIDLEKYLNFISSTSSKTEKCFKHKDLVGKIYCKNCGFYMCNICYSYHQVFEPTHETKYGTDEINFCHLHKEQNLDFYCENCDVNLCAECGRKFHTGHSVIQLREYWEKVNNKLRFHNNKELTTYIQNEILRYDAYTKQQITAIDKIILSFQQLRNIIEQNHKIAMKNNQLALTLIDSMYTEFYECKYYPKFHLIQNVENININILITKNDLLGYTRILDGINKHFRNLAGFHGEMSNKLIISERQRTINQSEFYINPKINNNIQFLNRKKQNEEVFQVPKESNTTNVINNSQLVNNNTTNNIILPIKVTAPIANKKPKDIFTFDAVICSKYISNNNTDTTHHGDSTNNYFESFSNTSSVYETFDCIHLGKVEDNQIIKKYRKKKEEQNKINVNNQSTQEMTKESKKNETIEIKNNTATVNPTVNESVVEDLDFFNSAFGQTVESPDIFNNTLNIDESLLGPKSPL